ncbi:hypothetical protein Tco_1220700 [Tanacetum coccineum]
MTSRRELFHQYKPISGGGSVYTCNDHELKIIGIGSVMVKMHDGTVRTIRDVRHVEGLKKNLLSLGQLDDLGCKVEIQDKIMKIIKGALVLMRGEKVAANLYQLKRELMEEAEASVASHSPSYRVAITWHQKLGHMHRFSPWEEQNALTLTFKRNEEDEYPFVNKYPSFQEEPTVLVEEESCPVYDTNNDEEESMTVYDTDIEDIIEEEE